jgi:hypothetical protein
VTYVCNGEPGATGPAGAVGATGATGAAGTNGTNGTNGANGLNGDAGATSLVKLSVEPPSTNCPAGGERIDEGTDANGDGILESTEISQTAYVCNGVGAAASDAGSQDAATEATTAQSDAATTDAGSPVAIPLTFVSNGYAASVDVGSQTFALEVDTGSATVVVAGASCGSFCAGIAQLYTPGSTATAVPFSTACSAGSPGGPCEAGITYGDGTSVSGPVYRDQVTLGSKMPAAPADLLVVQTGSNGPPFPSGFDGVLGLGPAAFAPDGTHAFIDQLQTADSAASVLSFQLCEGPNAAGTMWVGGYDATRIAAPLAYTPLVGGYGVDVTDVAIGGKSLGVPSSSYGTAYVDVGATTTMLPTAAFDALVSDVTANGVFASFFGADAGSATGSFWTFQGCLSVQNGKSRAQIDAVLPKMTITVPSASGSGSVTLDASATHSYLLPQPDGTYCPGVQPSSATILADSFLASQITVIDHGQALVGFAPQVGCP